MRFPTPEEYEQTIVQDDGRAFLRLAATCGLDVEDRGLLQRYRPWIYAMFMLDPEAPLRRSRRSDPDLPQWVQWHRVRSIDPSRRRGYRLPQFLRQAVITRDGYICGLCGTPVDPEDVHIDHRLPRFHGGSDDLENLQVAHSFCNLSKGARVAA